MTNHEINSAIAECCGAKWYVVTTADGTPARSLSLGRKEWWTETHDMSLQHLQLHMLPNFCQDLNAMHEAEGTLTDVEWKDYNQQLWSLSIQARKPVVHANSQIRARGFLRTKGLWKE